MNRYEVGFTYNGEKEIVSYPFAIKQSEVIEYIKSFKELYGDKYKFVRLYRKDEFDFALDRVVTYTHVEFTCLLCGMNRESYVVDGNNESISIYQPCRCMYRGHVLKNIADYFDLAEKLRGSEYRHVKIVHIRRKRKNDYTVDPGFQIICKRCGNQTTTTIRDHLFIKNKKKCGCELTE